MPLRPNATPTRDDIPAIPTDPAARYRVAVNDAIACLDRCYREASNALAVNPVPAKELRKWSELLNTLSRCSDALCKLE